VVTDNQKPLLEVRGLKTYFYTEDGVVKAWMAWDFVSIRRSAGLVANLLWEKCHISFDHALVSGARKIVEGENTFEGVDLVKSF